MLVIGFPAAAFATNCYVVAPQAGEQCLIIDPGIGVLDDLSQVLAENRLKPAAVLLTHGHIDHVFSVTPVCGAHDVPAVIHTDDAYRLRDPYSTLDPGLLAMLQSQFGRAPWTEPSTVRQATDAEQLDLAGLSVGVIHAPGHTEGSVMFSLESVPDGADDSVQGTLFSGDVLFAGSIGRTDLQGGSDEAMRTSLRTKVLTRNDHTLVLPGHGPATTIGRERKTNPYLTQF